MGEKCKYNTSGIRGIEYNVIKKKPSTQAIVSQQNKQMQHVKYSKRIVISHQGKNIDWGYLKTELMRIFEPMKEEVTGG
jgi:hypothetical protein